MHLRRALPIILSLVLPAAAVAAADGRAASEPSGDPGPRFSVGFQHLLWNSWGLGAGVSPKPGLAIEGFRSVVGDTSWAGRVLVDLASWKERRLYAYGLVASRRLSQVTGSTSVYSPGSGTTYIPEYGSETGIGVGSGVGIARDLSRWLGAPIVLSGELGVEHVTGFEKIDGGYTSLSLGVGLHCRF